MFTSLFNRFRKSVPATPSRQVAGSVTVGLDHVAARGVGSPKRPPRLKFRDGSDLVFTEAWRIWREHKLNIYRFGRSPHREITVSQPRDALLQFTYDTDYDVVRRMMFDAGMYVSPFDTITPEGIINA